MKTYNMIGPSRLQILEKQNKDLRIRLENRRGKAELALCAMEEEMEALKPQLCKKEKVIAMLQKEVAALTQELEEVKDLRAETMQGRIDAAVADATAPLLAKLEKAYMEIERLKAIVNKDPVEPSKQKPMGISGFKDIPNSRDKKGRKRGGQKGHPGHRLSLPENLDMLIEKGIIKKEVVDHADGASEYISRYVIDVEVVTTITEHRFAKGAELPKNMYNEVSYGTGARAMSILLINEGIIAEKRLSEMIEGLTHGIVRISPATLEKFKSQFAQKLESSGELDAIKEDLLNGEVINVDDTPMYCTQTVECLESGEKIKRDVEEGSCRATLRTHSNANSTFYTVNPKKDMEGIKQDDILTRFFSILSHDHESKFYNYGTLHATCGEHLLCDLIGLRDLDCIPWAEGMRKHMSKMNEHKNKDLEKGRDKCRPALLKRYEKEYDDLLERGREVFEPMQEGDFGYDGLRTMLNRLTDYKDCYLLFMRNYKAPFTNNAAERDLRMEKTKAKVSGPFRSWDGIVTHTKIRSFISTLKKRKEDLFSAIVRVNNEIPVLR